MTASHNCYYSISNNLKLSVVLGGKNSQNPTENRIFIAPLFFPTLNYVTVQKLKNKYPIVKAIAEPEDFFFTLLFILRFKYDFYGFLTLQKKKKKCFLFCSLPVRIADSLFQRLSRNC